MRRLILFLFALLPFAAQAQCAPAELAGSGTRAVLEVNATGTAAAWWCPGRFEPALALYAVRWDAMTDPLRADLAALSSARDQTVAGIDRMRATHATAPLASDALRPVWEQARERIQVSRPTNPLWLVAKNGTCGPGSTLGCSRPTYLVTNGVRGTTATSTRATVGASCGCVRLRVLEGTTVYCGVDGESELVAVCVRQPD